MITLDSLLTGRRELAADQLYVAGGLLPPIEHWWCLYFPETCYPWL